MGCPRRPSLPLPAPGGSCVMSAVFYFHRLVFAPIMQNKFRINTPPRWQGLALGNAVVPDPHRSRRPDGTFCFSSLAVPPVSRSTWPPPRASLQVCFPFGSFPAKLADRRPSTPAPTPGQCSSACCRPACRHSVEHLCDTYHKWSFHMQHLHG